MSDLASFFESHRVLLDAGFRPEGGGFLSRPAVTYHTAGELNANRDNVIWICHALTANSNPGEWWPDLFRENSWIDLERDFVVCVNVPGSCYGTFGPLDSGASATDYHNFPTLTIRDIVRVLQAVKDELQIFQIHTLIGASMGGQQALEWAIAEPELIERMVLIATNAKHSAWGIAFNASQRWAIEQDPTWARWHEDAGREGLKVARSIALLSYRSHAAYGQTQDDDFVFHQPRRPESYQRYQGEKLARRFNAFSYYHLSQTMDSHDVGRGRGGLENALQRVQAETLVLNLEGDLLFPEQEQRFLTQYIPRARFASIRSAYGHDGFLIETDQINQQLHQHFNRRRVPAPTH